MRFRLLGLDLCIGRHGPARDEDQCAGGAACAHNLGRHNLLAASHCGLRPTRDLPRGRILILVLTFRRRDSDFFLTFLAIQSQNKVRICVGRRAFRDILNLTFRSGFHGASHGFPRGCPADAAASTARRDAEPTSTAGPEQQAQPPRATFS